jgi:hypothetical protein
MIASKKKTKDSHLQSKGKVVACYFLHRCASSVPSRRIELITNREKTVWRQENRYFGERRIDSGETGDRRKTVRRQETGERQFGERASGPAGPLRKKVKMAKFLELGLIEK